MTKLRMVIVSVQTRSPVFRDAGDPPRIAWFWRITYRDTRPAIAPADTTWSREPSSLRRSPLSDMYQAVRVLLQHQQ